MEPEGGGVSWHGLISALPYLHTVYLGKWKCQEDLKEISAEKLGSHTKTESLAEQMTYTRALQVSEMQTNHQIVTNKYTATQFLELKKSMDL